MKIAGREVDPLDAIVKMLLTAGMIGLQQTQTTEDHVADKVEDTVETASSQWQELMEREVDMAHDRIAYLEGRIQRLEE
jgi:TPP-dependent pyruvate/acetoin dehydrogenase alpha subunit